MPRVHGHLVAALLLCSPIAYAQSSQPAAPPVFREGPPGSGAKVDATTAVETIAQLFTVNPLVKVDGTDKPLPTTGSWGAQVLKPESCPKAIGCMLVVYRVPEANIACTWLIQFARGAVPEKGGFVIQTRQDVLNENDNARRYTIKKDWLPWEPKPVALAEKNTHIVYPEAARAAHIGGAVVVEAVLDDTGAVKQTIVQSGPPVLRTEVIAAVSQWHFQPQMIGGKPASSRVPLTFNFGLYGNGAVGQVGMDGNATVYSSNSLTNHEGTLAGHPGQPVLAQPK